MITTVAAITPKGAASAALSRAGYLKLTAATGTNAGEPVIYPAQVTERSQQEMGAPAEANALQKESPGCTHARGLDTRKERSVKVGKPSPIRTICNVRFSSVVP